MKSLDEYYNQPVKKLTDEELKEWAATHRSVEELHQIGPDKLTMEEKKEVVEKFRQKFLLLNKAKIDKCKSLSPSNNNGFIYDEYLDLDITISEDFLKFFKSLGLEKILDEVTVEEYVEAPMGDEKIKKKIYHIFD